MEKRYSTQGILSFKQAESLVSKLVYSIEAIHDCSLDVVTQEVVVELTAESEPSILDQTMQLMMEREKNIRILSHRVFIESDRESLADLSAASLHEVESIYENKGSVQSDIALSLFDLLDNLFVSLALRHDAILRKYPSMIPLKTLEKCGYIHSFPQNIHLVSEIPHQLEVLEQVKHTDRLKDITRLSPFALSPAVCFHCYEELSGRRLQHPAVFTARGTCFRHEAPWRLGKHRLNEFSMREIVLFGNDSYIESTRKLFMNEVWGIFTKLGLAGKIETASDLFYFSEDAQKSQHQLMANMKYELVVNLGTGSGTFSIASFNHMSDTLCKPFEVYDSESKPFNSGCIAFGIDRWVYALLVVHGTQFEQWPAGVRSVLKGIKEPVK